MNIVKQGTTVRIFDKAVELMNDLPPGSSWTVECDDTIGPHLVEAPKPAPPTHAVYGQHLGRIKKVIAAYKSRTDGNTGVILSGAKGIGKTLFTRMLACEMAAEGFPVIMVNHFVPHLADFLASITQDSVVVFDEFDKNFDLNDTRATDSTAPQNSLLGLFDGVVRGHKLYLVTCNDISKVSKFYVNRPGRFRYHIRFAHPDMEAAAQYLKDRVPGISDGELSSIVKFTRLVPLSYDCLSAIADELSMGETFRSAMETLNIVRVGDDTQTFQVDVVLKYKDNTFSQNVSFARKIDLFTDDDSSHDSFWIRLGYKGVPGVPKENLYGEDMELGHLVLRYKRAIESATVTDGGEIVVPAGEAAVWRPASPFPEDEDDTPLDKLKTTTSNALIAGLQLVAVKLTPIARSSSINYSLAL